MLIAVEATMADCSTQLMQRMKTLIREIHRQVNDFFLWGRKLQSSDKQLKISDRDNCGSQKISNLPPNSYEIRIFSPKFCIVGRKVFYEVKFKWGQIIVPCLPPGHDATISAGKSVITRILDRNIEKICQDPRSLFS